MLFVLALSLPGLVLLLCAVALVDQLAVRAGRTRWVPWRGSSRVGQVSSTGFAQLHVALDPSKAHDVDERAMRSVLREDETDGAPPAASIDLGGGTAVIRRTVKG